MRCVMRKFFQENFYLLTAVMLTSVFMSNDAFLPAIPSMAAEFGSSNARLQQGVSFFVLGSLLLQILVGPLSDRYGRKPIMLGGALVFLLGSLGCILARDVQSFLTARLFQGSAMATTQVTSMAAINEYYSKDKAISALALSANINLLAPVLGPILGALVLSLPVPELLSAYLGAEPWRYIFVYIGVLGLLAAVMLLLFMPEPGRLPARQSLEADSPDTASESPATRSEANRNLLHIFRQLPRILSNRVIALYSISLSMGGFSLLLWITGAPVMLIQNLGLSENRYAWVQAPAFLCTVLGNSLAPFLARRFGALNHMNIAHCGILCFSPFVFLIAWWWQESAVALVVAFSLVSLSLGLINAVKNQFIISLSEYKGSVTGVLMLFGSSGVFLGSLAASFLGNYPNYYSFAVIALASFLLGFLPLLANFFMTRRRAPEPRGGPSYKGKL